MTDVRCHHQRNAHHPDCDNPDACRGGVRMATGRHTDTCDDPRCRGCVPCPYGHCGTCRRNHTHDIQPITCADCVTTTREDLTTVGHLAVALPDEARNGTTAGRPLAAAPIPGGTATILAGPAVMPGRMRTGHGYEEAHRPADPRPPGAILAGWEYAVRHWLGAPPRGRRSTVGEHTRWLIEHLDILAQARPHPSRPTPPTFARLSRDAAAMRRQLEAVVHDEQTNDEGISCFECGGLLVRRHAPAHPCRHDTPARRELARWLTLGYPEATDARLLRAAQRPCGGCDQGGIADPTPGLSWECIDCRLRYDPGQYIRAVRRDLLDADDAGAAGWCDITIAADAASTVTGRTVLPGTVRKWADRDQVATMLEEPRPGVWSRRRLVWWPDVAERAQAMGSRRPTAASS